MDSESVDVRRHAPSCTGAPKDSYIIRLPGWTRALFICVTLAGFLSAFEFVLGMVRGRTLDRTEMFRFLWLAALPAGIALWVLYRQTVHITADRIESYQYFKHRSVDRNTCRVFKHDLASFWLTDDVQGEKIRIYQRMPGANVLLFEISSRNSHNSIDK